MELQAIRYAAMVSRMTFQRAIRIFQAFLDKSGNSRDARSELLNWLTASEIPRDDTVLDVRIVLVSADFKKELTTAVLWLREWELDIRCVKVAPHADGDGIILEVQEIVPLKETSEYQISIREEAISRREIARETGELTGYLFMNTGEHGGYTSRSWEDCRKYGFMALEEAKSIRTTRELEGRGQSVRILERAWIRGVVRSRGRGGSAKAVHSNWSVETVDRTAVNREANESERPPEMRLVRGRSVDTRGGSGTRRAKKPFPTADVSTD